MSKACSVEAKIDPRNGTESAKVAALAAALGGWCAALDAGLVSDDRLGAAVNRNRPKVERAKRI